jgi:hypothetical protein
VSCSRAATGFSSIRNLPLNSVGLSPSKKIGSLDSDPDFEFITLKILRKRKVELRHVIKFVSDEEMVRLDSVQWLEEHDEKGAISQYNDIFHENVSNEVCTRISHHEHIIFSSKE